MHEFTSQFVATSVGPASLLAPLAGQFIYNTYQKDSKGVSSEISTTYCSYGVCEYMDTHVYTLKYIHNALGSCSRL